MSRLHLHILGSGSKGNCALIEGPRGLIMIDDGLSRRETLKRMAELGLSADNVSALLITHEHSDHIKDVYKRQDRCRTRMPRRGTGRPSDSQRHRTRS